MSEDDTMKKLRQLPIEEMLDLYHKVRANYSPVVNLGHTTHMTKTYRPPEIVLHYERLNLLEKHGWTFDEFVSAVEKRAILSEVKDFNDNLIFPVELLDRAKQFFPNLKFTEAKIELND